MNEQKYLWWQDSIYFQILVRGDKRLNSQVLKIGTKIGTRLTTKHTPFYLGNDRLNHR